MYKKFYFFDFRKITYDDELHLDCRTRLILKRIEEEIRLTFPREKDFRLTQLVTISWKNVGHYRDNFEKVFFKSIIQSFHINGREKRKVRTTS